MLTKYKGWSVPSKVIIVARECSTWMDGRRCPDGTYQGYVVDSENKSMLNSARNWAHWVEHRGNYDKKTQTYEETIEHQGVEHEFDNEGFTLELLDSAGDSSQGGKLSFWNCKISKDCKISKEGKEFIVSIASDYLLEILLYNDFKNGVCQSTLSFARCKSGVGMMNETMPSYKQFLQDEERRANMKKKKTKTRSAGHLYSTLTGGNVYFSTYYRWYEPVYSDSGSYLYSSKIIGFKKLTVPETLYWQPCYSEDLTKKSEYAEREFYLDDKVPARTDCGVVAEIDVSDQEVLDRDLRKKFTSGFFHEYVGLSTSKESYTLPSELREWLISRDYRIWE